MRRLIFLDIDGVLNNMEWFLQRGRAPWTLSYAKRLRHSIAPRTIDNLNAITDATGARIVLSSSWREYASWETTARALGSMGMTGTMIGATPRREARDPKIFARYQGRYPAALEPYPRGYEIQQWIEENTELAPQLVILDDDADMEHLSPRLVQTSFREGGLTQDRVTEAIRLLR